MQEQIYTALAKKILDESLHLKKGETLVIETWNNGLPFARKVIIEAKRRGVIPLTIFEDEDAFIEAGRTLSDENIGKMGRHEFNMLTGTDAYIFIPGPQI